ncbi:MFS general substrate transporter [Coprinopsis marcescibilis]|uniref:MFS general substrate transporter n=1 Tax=Coprinopsis marcescibilis TaxID=230819 RepID=A0A5C3L6Q7_COPMA|nr:MFS general substrate transporter [Coprinopsis marcescibilis]
MVESESNTVTVHDEQTPLLIVSKPKKPRTPLPKLQLAIAIFLQIGEPLTSQSIYPYVNQLIRELDVTGGDDRKVGYYAGLIESLFFATEAVTVLHWSRLSDHVGRKPVLLIGIFGSMVSMLSFGLSKTFLALIVSRCLQGLLNGNVGVMKSVMGDLTDTTNRAEAFALLSLVWATGCTVGPLIGGTLSHPHERFPNAFPSPFWKSYPYFLPCLVVAIYLFSAFLVTLTSFKETVKKKERNHKRGASDNTVNTLAQADDQPPTDAAPVKFRELLIYPVLLSVSNYAALAFLNLCMYALLPLFLAMPVEIGGLGVSPQIIGLALGVYGATTGAVQTLLFARIVRYFGERNTFVFSMFSYIPAFFLFPVISIAARSFGVGWLTWTLIGLLVAFLSATDLGYGCIFMFVTASSPNKQSLGATNGLSQMSVSFARAVGPWLATSMFSFSVEKNILGGYGVYAFLIFASCFAVGWASRLPKEGWPEKYDHDDIVSREICGVSSP